ncbi:MAG TPA: hypothetical protein VKA85_06940 [Candidatus Limnocylindrales bacterium]|nr:hypothetical protein [Candidatus Limnocylindrales bacterium]
MRPTRLLAGLALTAAFAVAALPSLAGSRSPTLPLDPALFQGATSALAGDALDPRLPDAALRSDGFIDPDASLVEPRLVADAAARPWVGPPRAAPGFDLKPPRYTLSGWASFYDNGTTAMRLPRGTLVVICGTGGCVERRVSDYGPNAAVHPERIADLYRPDFFAVCGCPSFAGTAKVTVSVY